MRLLPTSNYWGTGSGYETTTSCNLGLGGMFIGELGLEMRLLHTRHGNGTTAYQAWEWDYCLLGMGMGLLLTWVEGEHSL